MFSEGDFEYKVPTTEEPAHLISIDFLCDIILSDDFYCKQLPNGHRILHTSVGNIVTGNAPQVIELTITSIQLESLANSAQHWTFDAIENVGNWKPSASWTILQTKMMRSASNSSMKVSYTSLCKGASFKLR
ncbi:hypothetical protein KIN20_029607 [Parelaphostrongylus tenuis]|uniref:Uncharacterized protein n=1 Tax=Parelaphostrongylus tenuis TaxID=148309 RepID=A0AAD5R2T7_PARTN|nr:hypothetical protein KIN20_029607 [Parelaphostrongylus tenuis]